MTQRISRGLQALLVVGVALSVPVPQRPAPLQAAEAQDAAAIFESLYGADLKRVKATPDPRDDLELAKRLLDATREAAGVPDFLALLCDRAYELAAASPEGYPTALAAMETESARLPVKAVACGERIVEVRQRQLDVARGDERLKAGEALIDALLALADAKTAAGAAAEAPALCRRAQAVAISVRSPKKAAIDARLSAMTEVVRTSREIDGLKNQLAANPQNPAVREKLVRLYLVDLDSPAVAAKYVDGVEEAGLRKYVPAAARPIESAPELACMELGEWYRTLGESASPAAKAAMFARAQAYYRRFLSTHTAQDMDRMKASLALKKVEADLAKLPAAPAAAAPLEAVGPVPTPQQLAWHDAEYALFVHFSINTFTNRESGDGKEDPRLFNPTAFDARQWVNVCKEAGAQMLILTAKHEAGFCLWPSRVTDYTVARSPWRGGRGDMVREVADACRQGGIKFGVFLSGWDAHEPTFGSNSAAYNRFFCNLITEILTNYGEISELWIEGGPGNVTDRGQQYDWPAFAAAARKCQPKTLVACQGPDIRWVGNYRGQTAETEWCVQPAHPQFHAGMTGNVWWPAQCGLTLRRGWFYHPADDARSKPLDELVNIYYTSVGRNAGLLLNLSPDTRGLIPDGDGRRLRDLAQVLGATFRTNFARGKSATATSVRGTYAAGKAVDGDGATFWAAKDGDPAPALEVDLGGPATFNVAMVQEMIAYGQRVEEFTIEALSGGTWVPATKGTTVGHKRLLYFQQTTATKVRLTITKSRAAPTVREFGLYLRAREPSAG